ncbi:hypothetical protein C8R47DRAFT_1158163 [Mycena vitilis]|nr:hypothetical protein C8R47DRAFT_1158163 [Mycena vitilis]
MHIEDCADDIETTLESLPMPSSQDSPATRSAWQRLFGLLHEAKDVIAEKFPDFLEIFQANKGAGDDDDDRTLTQEMEDGAGKGPGEDEEEEEEAETPAQKKQRKKDAAHLAVVKRAQRILGALGQTGIPANDLTKMIAAPVRRVAEQAEDHALACLIRGYNGPVQGETWGKLLKRFIRHSADDTISFMALSSELDEKVDVMRRDTNLRHTESAAQSRTYLVNLIHKIETIKCAAEWTAQTGRGAGNYKNDFHTKLFQSDNKRLFAHLTERQKQLKMEELSAEFVLFKKQREELITARNRLLFAYLNFGTGVLIDPFFSAPNLGQRRAHGFKSLLDVFIALAPPSEEVDGQGRNRFDEVERKNRDVLYDLTATLCGKDSDAEQTQLADFLDNFYIRYPSHVRP